MARRVADTCHCYSWDAALVGREDPDEPGAGLVSRDAGPKGVVLALWPRKVRVAPQRSPTGIHRCA